ncbi:hypothetical protein PtA15_10A520 [Puccinia triticina]|uniref:Protein kinase domain-containing protein n=1 Tax=Puccinia triticina TaxID=208348 RepID=A0ABY7CYA0_9BASI|nr:uncharacterized protein PtA15_10A520 [Puccinia triticina]WAQ89096.1 hypothetical protein PtA15_10A520 [Puccinia triticina]
MIHLPQRNSLRSIFCGLLAFVDLKGVIPGSQEAITTDLIGTALEQGPAIPTTPPSTNELSNAAQRTYSPHFNDDRFYLQEPSSPAGYHESTCPGDLSNYYSATIVSLPSSPTTVVTPRGSSMHMRHQISMQKLFNPELAQRILNCVPFTPGYQKDEDDFQIHDSIQNQAKIGNQVKDPQKPKDNPVIPSKVPFGPKKTTEIRSSTNCGLEMDPDRFMKVKNFIKTFGVVIPSAVAYNKRPGSNSPHGSKECLSKNPKVGGLEENADRLDETSASSHTECSSVSDILSQEHLRVKTPGDRIWRAKRQKKLNKKMRMSSKATDSKSTPEQPPRGYEIEYPSLTPLSEESNAAQRGQSIHPRQQEIKDEEAAPNHIRQQKQEYLRKSDQQFPLAKSHGLNENIDSPQISQPTVSLTLKQKGDKVKGSPRQRPSQLLGQSKGTGTEPLQPSRSILDQDDPQAKEKTRILMGIVQPISIDSAPQTPIQPATPRKTKQLHASSGWLFQQAKKEVSTKSNEKHERNKIKVVSKDPRDSLTKLIHERVHPLAGKSSSTATQKSLLPQNSVQEPKHHSKTSTNPDRISALNNEGLSNLPKSPLPVFAQIIKSDSGIKTIPLQASQITHSPADSLESVLLKTLTVKEHIQDPINGPEPIRIPNTQAIETLQKQLDQLTSERKEETSQDINNTLKGSSIPAHSPQHPAQLKYHHISTSNLIPTQSIPPMGLSERRPTKISRLMFSLTQRKDNPLNKITPEIKALRDSSLEPQSSSMAPENLKAHANSKLLHSPPSFTTDDPNQTRSCHGIISLESAFGDIIGWKNSESRRSPKNNVKGGVHLGPMLPLRRFFRVENRSTHVQVGFITKDDYDILRSLWRKDSSGYKSAESSIRDEIGTFEGTRRLIALRRQILSHTISREWAAVRELWYGGKTKSRKLSISFEDLYGLSSDPWKVREIPISSTLARSSKEIWEAKPYCVDTWGNAEMDRQINMRSYLAHRTNPFSWWEDYYLNDESKLFGLDITTILKVGDSLQFGAKFLVGRGFGRLSIDSAYALLLEVMTDTNRPLPWIESSERAWLSRLPEGLYEERLRRLSQLISDRKPQMNPLSTEILARKMGTNYLKIVRGAEYRMGEELIWVDKGYPLNELLEEMENRRPTVFNRMPDLPEPRRIPTWEEFKDILTTSAHYFLNFYYRMNLSVSSQVSHHRSQNSISSSIGGHDQPAHSPSSTSNRSIGASVYPTTFSSTFDPLAEDGGKLNDPQKIIEDIQAAMNGISSTSLNPIVQDGRPCSNRTRSGSSTSVIRPISARRPRTAETINKTHKLVDPNSSNSLTVPSGSTDNLSAPTSTPSTSSSLSSVPSTTTRATNHDPANTTIHPVHQSTDHHDHSEDFSEDQGFEEIEFEPSDLEVLNSLGEGAGGEVRKVLHRPSGLYMAKKTIPTSPNPSLHRQILRELAFNREVADGESPSIVKYYGAFLEENNTQIAILMEYCEGGSLEAIYKRIKHRKGRIGEKILGKVAESVLSGLSYLHTRHIIHRDIKPSNILVTRDGLIKICDLGVSGELIGSMAGTFMGTSAYMAPERIRGETYSITSDVWSLGLTLLELAMNRFPLVNMHEDGSATPLQPFELLQTVVTFEMPSMNEEEGIVWTKSLQHFIKTCLDKNPNQRPGPKILLEQHPWITKSRTWTPDVKTWLIKVWDW